MTRARYLLVVSLALAVPEPAPGRADGLGTQLMLATLKVVNPDSTGTGFVLSQRDPAGAQQERSVLVTADHVLNRSKGAEVTLVYHRRQPDGTYAKLPAHVAVRREGKALWTKHPDADVAALRVTPPPDACLPRIAVSLLATDSQLTEYQVEPGDALRCVGFPHPNQFEANSAGFGVVRAGCLASFPLLPTRQTKTFLFDFNVFEGDSGSPVYLAGGTKAEPKPVPLILGLVAGQHFIDEEFKTIYQAGKFRHRMGMAIVVHASAIKETIERLPADAK